MVAHRRLSETGPEESAMPPYSFLTSNIYIVSNLVNESQHRGKMIYTCALCKLGYANMKTAKECEAFCKSHDACSLEITKKAVYKPEQQSGDP